MCNSKFISFDRTHQSLKNQFLQDTSTSTTTVTTNIVTTTDKDKKSENINVVSTIVYPITMRSHRIMHLTITGIKIFFKAVECLSNTILDSSKYPFLTRSNVSAYAMTDKWEKEMKEKGEGEGEKKRHVNDLRTMMNFILIEKEELYPTSEDTDEDEEKQSQDDNDDDDGKKCVEVTRLDNIGLNENTNLKWFDLHDNGISGVNCGLALKSMLSRNQSWISLTLFQNNLQDIGCNLLCEGLVDNKDDSRLYRLRLSMNGITYKSSENISNILSNLNNLSRLEIQRNPEIVCGNNTHYPSFVDSGNNTDLDNVNTNTDTNTNTTTNENETQSQSQNKNTTDCKSAELPNSGKTASDDISDNNNNGGDTIENTENRVEMNGIITICQGLSKALHLKEFLIDDCRLGMNGGLALRNAILKQHQNVGEMIRLAMLLLQYWKNVESEVSQTQGSVIDEFLIAIEKLFVNEFLGFTKLTKLGVARCYINQKEPGIVIVEVMEFWETKPENKQYFRDKTDSEDKNDVKNPNLKLDTKQ